MAMNCTNCGTALTPSTSFCANCGTPVQKASTATPAAPAQQIAPPSAPYTYAPAGSVNGLAIASLSVSIGSLLISAGTFGFVGAVLGHFALKQIKQRGQGGRGLAIAGIAVGWATTAFWTLVLVMGILAMSLSYN
jgi:hypothetical protein